MKRLMVVEGKTLQLVLDPLNRRILEMLVEADRSVKTLSKSLGEQPLKVWRRVQRLRANGLIVESGRRRTRNLEEKLYRAAAAYYVSREALSYEPKDTLVGEAYKIYVGIRRRMLGALMAYQDVPEKVSPQDFFLATDMYVFAKVLTQPETQKEIRKLLELLEESPLKDLLETNQN